MTQGSHEGSQALERLSALVDGEVERAAVAELCGACGDGSTAREKWHAWHLIGDVLRSEDLSSDARHDAQFLRALRTRMAGEAIVFAPAFAAAPSTAFAGSALPAISPERSRHSRTGWRQLRAPAAVAAGFVAVAGVLLAIQAPAPRPAVETLAAAPEATVRAVANAAPVGVALSEARDTIAHGKLLRDARLDQYLAAHKQFGGSTALGVPSGFLRSATVEVPSR